MSTIHAATPPTLATTTLQPDHDVHIAVLDDQWFGVVPLQRGHEFYLARRSHRGWQRLSSFSVTLHWTHPADAPSPRLLAAVNAVLHTHYAEQLATVTWVEQVGQALGSQSEPCVE